MSFEKVESRKAGKPYGKEVVDKIIELRRQGFSYAVIHQKTGVSAQTVAKYCQKEELGGLLGYKRIDEIDLEKILRKYQKKDSE